MKPEIEATTDFVFRRLFANEAQKQVPTHLLNAVLQAGQRREVVRELTLHDPVSIPEHTQDKETIYDIHASDQGMRRYLLEMQRQGMWYFPKRALYYGASEYSRQLQIGENYVTLQPVFVIAFVLQGRDKKTPWHQIFVIQERTTGVQLVERAAFVHTSSIPDHDDGCFQPLHRSFKELGYFHVAEVLVD